jgi:hypothetical protein
MNNRQKQVAGTTDSVVRGFFEGRTADRKNGGPRYPAHWRDSLFRTLETGSRCGGSAP